MIFVGKEGDLISPATIEHAVEEFWADEDKRALQQRYNYLDYHFEKDGRYCRARMYLAEPRTVTLFGPFKARGTIEQVDDQELEQAVLHYLNRRFADVKRLRA